MTLIDRDKYFSFPKGHSTLSFPSKRGLEFYKRLANRSPLSDTCFLLTVQLELLDGTRFLLLFLKINHRITLVISIPNNQQV